MKDKEFYIIQLGNLFLQEVKSTDKTSNTYLFTNNKLDALLIENIDKASKLTDEVGGECFKKFGSSTLYLESEEKIFTD